MTTPTPVETTTALLTGQWLQLRAWLGSVIGNDPSVAAAPSVLDGWSMADLVAHLGTSMSALDGVGPAEAGAAPMSLGEYLHSYASGAAMITAKTQDFATAIQHDPLAGIDAAVAGALQSLRDLGPTNRVVTARRGPILLSDMVLTRVIELVVHADDLQRSVARLRGAATGTVEELGAGDSRPLPLATSATGDGPLDPAATTVVAEQLLTIAAASEGWSLVLDQPVTWIRLAAGRVPYSAATLTAAVSPAWTGDALPDLREIVPVL